MELLTSINYRAVFSHVQPHFCLPNACWQQDVQPLQRFHTTPLIYRRQQSPENCSSVPGKVGRKNTKS